MGYTRVINEMHLLLEGYEFTTELAKDLMREPAGEPSLTAEAGEAECAEGAGDGTGEEEEAADGTLIFYQTFLGIT